VIAVNDEVKDRTDLVNTDPFGAGWLLKITLTGGQGYLMDATAYAAYVDSIKH